MIEVVEVHQGVVDLVEVGEVIENTDYHRVRHFLLVFIATCGDYCYTFCSQFLRNEQR